MINRMLVFLFYILEAVIDAMFWAFIATIYIVMVWEGLLSGVESNAAFWLLVLLPLIFIASPYIRFLCSATFYVMLVSLHRNILDVIQGFPSLFESAYTGSASALVKYAESNEMFYILASLIVVAGAVFLFSKVLNTTETTRWENTIDLGMMPFTTSTTDEYGLWRLFKTVVPLALLLVLLVSYINFTAFILNNNGSLLLPALVFIFIFDPFHWIWFKDNYIPCFSRWVPKAIFRGTRIVFIKLCIRIKGDR
ncbi:hypothetical protein P886_2000 [Alteromonadaceae bacterium 2753L.S.0a.02]|nr:hypothetical protein P886_2000 [Alteromonadaceae bacterium 2753L.S.0a.02]